MNTERVGKEGEKRLSFLDLDPPKQLFLFNSFGFTGFKDFIIQDDQKIINKILYGINDFNKKGNVINIILLKFSIATYENFKEKEEIREAKLQQIFFIYLKEKLHNVKEVTINLVDDEFQETENNTYGLFKLYFYENLLLPL